MSSEVPPSPSHWTYHPFEPNCDLMQGDIIARTSPLVEILKEAHSYFQDEKYLGFIVVTQSCDLVRRKQNECKAHYINLAVIRSLNSILDILFKGFGTSFVDVYNEDKRSAANDLVERILNQNEQAIGLFYLHPDSVAGVAEASVAVLRVTIALRVEHYELLLKSRKGRLKPEFGNKLGWLVGNLYSRVATQDWSEEMGDDFKKRCKSLVTKDGRRYWLPSAIIEHAVKLEIHKESLVGEAAVKRIQSVAPKSHKEVAIDRVCEIVGSVLSGSITPEQVRKLRLQLNNDRPFKLACRQ